MKNIWLKYKLLMITASGLVIIVAVIWAAQLLTARVENISSQIKEKKLDQEILDSRLEKLSEMEENWRAVEEQGEALGVILGPEQEIAFIESIEAIAVRTNNAISLKIGENTDPKEIAKLKKSGQDKNAEKGILDEVAYTHYFPMQINLKGGYSELVNFVHFLESSRFYVNIITIDSKKEILPDSQGGDIFSGKKAAEKKEASMKEIINTNINAIVYTKN